jgi:hypothetical protein
VNGFFLRAQRSLRFAIVLTAAWFVTATPAAQDRKTLDLILDTYVRDGFVYYRALKIDRSKLDSYVAQLGSVAPDKLSRDERLAFWLNAYNALVLRTVIDHYPIQARSKEYPPKSIRQIPGAFERLAHRVGGSSLTLDQIEQNILPDFHDPRVYLAVGRGAVGGGRLRSEAFSPERLEAQLTEVANECATRPECVHIDRENNKVSVSAIFSWREKDFTGAYAATAPSTFSNRSPIERAVIGLVGPRLLTIEKDFLEKNTFQLAYAPFDWTLNDLTGRGGR